MIEQGLIDSGIRLVQTLGFPIFVCAWFMFRAEKRLDSQTGLLQKIAQSLSVLTKDEIGTEE